MLLTLKADPIISDLKRIWGEALGVDPESIDENLHFFEHGGFSLLAIRMAESIGGYFKIPAPMDTVLTHSTISALAEFVQKAKAGESREEELKLVRDPCSEGPFELTDLQQGYWIGETSQLNHSGPGYFYSLHGCQQFDIAAFDAAVNELIARHDILRVRFTSNALQEVLENPPRFRSECIDATQESPEGVQRILDRIEGEIVGNHLALDQWPLFRFWIIQGPEEWFVWSLFKLIIGDGRSGEIFASELKAILEGRRLKAPLIRFRDYVHSVRRFRETARYRASMDYWTSLVPGMAGPPELPRSADADSIESTPMVHRSFQLPAADWSALKAECKRHGVTPTAFMCSLFCSVLSYWSRNASFTLNMMYANRPNLIEGMFDVFGNFSNTILIPHEWSQGETFRAKTARLQAALLERLSHASVSGVEVNREMNRSREDGGVSILPFVFASGLGLNGSGEDEALFFEKLGWTPLRTGINTPQVVFDHQIAENRGALVMNWDTRDRLFPFGMIEEMFAAYRSLVSDFAANPDCWERVSFDLLPPKQRDIRASVNATYKDFPRDRLMYHGFLEQASRSPDSVFVLNGGRAFTYADVKQRCLAVAGALIEAGIGKGDVVPILMDKGWEQVVATLAIQMAGAAYLPISSGTPDARVKSILAKVLPKVALRSGEGEYGVFLRAGIELLDIHELMENRVASPGPLSDRAAPGDLAYIIFTSGTTGDPNGVAITHAAAMNTILDVNARFDVTDRDRILSISELNFDLSVYDIFGMAEAGASLVIPDREMAKNPIHFQDLIDKHGVTLWNTVPAYLEMLVSLVEFKRDTTFASLRLALLSGDWIPVTLPDRLSAINPGVRLVGLGGATEASIWSNYFSIGAVPKEWKSIPYGYPLANQRFHVLDASLRHRPDHVAGELYIAGEGLAREYFGNKEKTQERFLVDPVSGERLYRTGDWGRYWEDGTLEFLGRQDSQVKIRGFRIELGEINTAFRKLPGVEEAVSITYGEGSSKSIATFVKRKAGAPESAASYKQRIQEFLPAYMVPGLIEEISDFPLTANGKVNAKALEARIRPPGKAGGRTDVPPTEVEAGLIRIWEECLVAQELGKDANFFQAGGNSIMAVSLINRIEAALKVRLPLAVLYHQPTPERMAGYLASYQPRKQDCLVELHAQGGREAVFMIHPIGGGILCYAPAVEVFKSDYDLYGIQSPSLREADAPSRGLAQMASEYADRVAASGKGSEVRLLGWSMGGLLSILMKPLLEAKGFRVRVIALDPWVGRQGIGPEAARPGAMIPEFFKNLSAGDIRDGGYIFRGDEPGSMLTEYRRHLEASGIRLPALDDKGLMDLFAEYARNLKAILGHQAPDVDEGVLVYVAGREDRSRFPFLRPLVEGSGGRGSLASETHFTMVGEGFLRSIKPQVREFFAAVTKEERT